MLITEQTPTMLFNIISESISVRLLFLRSENPRPANQAGEGETIGNYFALRFLETTRKDPPARAMARTPMPTHSSGLVSVTPVLISG